MFKLILKKIFGLNNIYYLLNLRLLFLNYKEDLKLFMRDSTVFKINNFENKEAVIILAYHSLEKGFLFKNNRHVKHIFIKIGKILFVS